MQRTPKQIIGEDALLQLIFEGYEVVPAKTQVLLHEWVKSTLGHGYLMCRRCSMTDLEAAALGRLERCEPPSVGNSTVRPDEGFAGLPDHHQPK